MSRTSTHAARIEDRRASFLFRINLNFNLPMTSYHVFARSRVSEIRSESIVKTGNRVVLSEAHDFENELLREVEGKFGEPRAFSLSLVAPLIPDILVQARETRETYVTRLTLALSQSVRIVRMFQPVVPLRSDEVQIFCSRSSRREIENAVTEV